MAEDDGAEDDGAEGNGGDVDEVGELLSIEDNDVACVSTTV